MCKPCSSIWAFRIPAAMSEASALAMDKHLTKKLLAAEGLPTAAWDLFDLSGGTLPLLPGSLDLPLVIKPRFEGSSLGVNIVQTHEQWTNAMIAAAKNYGKLWPKSLEGREFTSGFSVKKRSDHRNSAERRRVLHVRSRVCTRRQHAHRAREDRRRSCCALADDCVVGAPVAWAARLFAHGFYRDQRGPAADFGDQYSTRFDVDESRARCMCLRRYLL